MFILACNSGTEIQAHKFAKGTLAVCTQLAIGTVTVYAQLAIGTVAMKTISHWSVTHHGFRLTLIQSLSVVVVCPSLMPSYSWVCRFYGLVLKVHDCCITSSKPLAMSMVHLSLPDIFKKRFFFFYILLVHILSSFYVSCKNCPMNMRLDFVSLE